MTPSMLDNAPDFLSWTWADIEPQYAALEAQEITAENVSAFLEEWSHLQERIEEIQGRTYIATTQDTSDEYAKARFAAFLEEIFPQVQPHEQRLREKLLASGLVPNGLELAIRRMRVDVDLFRAENIPLQAEEAKLSEQYITITGGQTIEWEGETVSITQLSNVLSETDRDRREQAWRAIQRRRLQDREAIDSVWKELLRVRRQEAANAGYGDYRAYTWAALKRFDYTPDNAQELHRAVEDVVVPVVARLYERRRQRLGLETLRPWDLQVDPANRPPLRPFDEVAELTRGVSAIFHQLDTTLGSYIDTMEREGLLDLEGRLNKAPVGYMYPLSATRKPFIFFEARGNRADVETLLHEGGHAAHVFEAGRLPYHLQRSLEEIPMEFCEVGSMAMEFLGEPYFTRDKGGFYTEEEAARARLDHIEQRVLALWCSIAQTDAVQHWMYEHPDEAADPARIDEAWLELSRRYSPVVDWSGLETERAAGWRVIPHIFEAPFYMIEYALAELGAVQIAANADRDQAEAVRQYRAALALGGTVSLPELYRTAGARFAFDAETFRSAVDYLEGVIVQLDAQLE